MALEHIGIVLANNLAMRLRFLEILRRELIAKIEKTLRDFAYAAS